MQIKRDDAFQTMKDAKTKAAKLGKFYTPDCLCRLLARLAKIPDVRRIYDPTCGSGGLLLYGREEYGLDVELIGEEIDPESVELCRENWATAGAKGEVHCADVLLHPAQIEPVDVVLANPPFGVPWDPTQAKGDPAFPVLAPKGRADLAFIQRGLARLLPGGKLAVIIPSGVLTSSNAELEIRKTWLGELETVVSLPGKLFDGTSIAVYALVFTRSGARSDVLFVDAEAFSERESRSKSTIAPERIDEIVRVVSERKDSEISKLVPNERVDPVNLSVPFYLQPKRNDVAPVPSVDELFQQFRADWLDAFQNGIDIYWGLAESCGRKAELPDVIEAKCGEKIVKWKRIED